MTMESGSRHPQGLSLGVDIGGTFTDLFGYEEESGRIYHAKSPTTPRDLAAGVRDCVRKSGLALQGAEDFIHGSTIAINIAIERTGARTALVVTRGTRDVYLIGRGNRPEAYNIFFQRPTPLVPRHLIFEINQRQSASGDVLMPFDAQQAASVARRVSEMGAESVAVCFLHSYFDPTDETRMGAILREENGGTYISLSHEIVREYREYERTSTAVLNAYIGPKTSHYIGLIEDLLDDEGFEGRFLIMQSNGGVMSPETAKSIPVAMMESGPVGGVMASAQFGSRLGHDNIIAFDMGGTTAKTSLIEHAEPTIAQGYYIGGYASGHPVLLPVIDIVEVGAGGGSIAWIDEVGALKVGPQSAGAEPGPIAYRRGGTSPTVTDANVVLGRIGSDSFLGGEMKLDTIKAKVGIAEQLAPALGLDPTAVALAIVKIAVAKMSLAVRGVSVERGFDPRDFVMMAFGGAGPVHALEIARQLSIPTVIVPVYPAHFSALGMLMTDVRHDYVRTYYRPLLEANFSELGTIFSDLIETGRGTLTQEGVPHKAMAFERSLDLRYVGQEFSLQIPVSREELADGDLIQIRRHFDEMHDRRYGHASSDEPLELVNARLTARGERRKIKFPPVEGGQRDAQIGTRPIYLENPAHPVECAVYARDRIAAGLAVRGPAVVEEYASTTLLFPNDVATIVATGEIVIEVGSA